MSESTSAAPSTEAKPTVQTATQSTITVAKALKNIKLIDKRIYEKISETYVGSYIQGDDNPPVGCTDLKECLAKAQGNTDAVDALIEQRKDIKSVIILSNAKTTVTIAGETLTVAAAIERKTFVAVEKNVIQQRAAQLEQLKSVVERQNNTALNLANAAVQSFLQNVSKEATASDDQSKAIFAQVLKDNRATFVIPKNLEKNLGEAYEKIITFESDVDDALNTSNVMTIL